ncbi:hypothetical protein [Nocardia sp. NPDC051570]|uniref:hypothetical protein n=1 Tax=Nocardia sp. NPDC051570 TaxID=3364324 RepID=UPI003797F73F
MQLTHTAEWQDLGPGSSLEIADYFGLVGYVHREGAFIWLVALNVGPTIIDKGFREDELDARDAAEDAIREHNAKANP